MALIEARGLIRNFGAIQAVDGVSLSIGAGEIYGLVGSDGAGKTTTLRLLVGALRPDAGEITLCGFSIRTQTDRAREKIGYLSQRFSLYEDLTVLENIRFFAEVRGLEAGDWKPRCLELLHFVGLEKFSEREAGQLSGGMKQKLGTGLCPGYPAASTAVGRAHYGGRSAYPPGFLAVDHPYRVGGADGRNPYHALHG